MAFSDLELAQLSKAAYGDKTAVKKVVKADSVLSVANKKTGTQAFVVYRGDSIAVVFRGTENSGKDVLTDAKAWKTCRGPYRIHQGFMSSYMSVHRRIARLVRHQIEKKIYVTGHSLGGALAQICALLNPQPRMVLVTFGSPKIGDNSVAKAVSAIEGRHYINHADVVPRLPKINYWTPEIVHYFNRNGDLKINPSYTEKLKDRFFHLFEGIEDHGIDDYIRLVAKQND